MIQLHVNHAMLFEGAVLGLIGAVALLAPERLAGQLLTSKFATQPAAFELVRMLGVAHLFIAFILATAIPAATMKRTLTLTNTFASLAHAYTLFSGKAEAAGITSTAVLFHMSVNLIFAFTFLAARIEHAHGHRNKKNAQKAAPSERGE